MQHRLRCMAQSQTASLGDPTLSVNMYVLSKIGMCFICCVCSYAEHRLCNFNILSLVLAAGEY